MHLIRFIMIVSFPLLLLLAPLQPFCWRSRRLRAVISRGGLLFLYGGCGGGGGGASITADIHRSSVHSQMMMINIRRIIATNEMRFADESHSSKFKRKKKKQGKRDGEEEKKKRTHRKALSDSAHLSI